MTLETLQDTRLRQARWLGWASLVANILIVVTHSERLAAQFPTRFDIADGQ